MTFLTPKTLLKYLPLSAPLCVAYSGGLDSHVLLHSIVQLKRSVRAIHVNHHLSPNADQWALHCQKVCVALQVPCEVKNLYPSDTSEAALRKERYALFSESLLPGEYLLTAHHLDDQAETVLLRLLRGAGVKGLSGIPSERWLGKNKVIRPFLSIPPGIPSERWLGKNKVIRPFLSIPRSTLLHYAHMEGLNWIEDESNQSVKFDRNYIRHTILPLLKDRWPAASNMLARTAEYCRETDLLLNEKISKDINFSAKTLSVSQLIEHNKIYQKVYLRYWLTQLGLSVPNAKTLDRIISECLYSKIDAIPLVAWKGVEVRRFKDNLYAGLPLSFHNPAVQISWGKQTPLVLPYDMGTLTLIDENHVQIGEQIACLPKGNISVTVRFRQGGEGIRLAGRTGSHTLKNLFQEWKVPPWLRDRTPLIYFGDDLAVVVGYVVAEKYRTENG